MLTKICIKCNVELPLNIDNFYFIEYKNSFINQCRSCHKNKQINDRIRREEKAKSLGYISEHHYKMVTNKNYLKYRRSQELKLLTKKSDAIRNKVKIEKLTDAYVISLIKGIDKDKITPELIELYRLNVQLKRQLNDVR